ncbi:MAG TPA: hypothetical protein EYG40_02230 [Verrucomicrobia bacterium]|nr:hypothetical protein [Verrucomicrobiales bacterium]HIL53835.1 hypothetical protein [Verrucomicrobiota bacterium]
MKISLLPILSLFFSLLFFSSCGKKETPVIEDQTTAPATEEKVEAPVTEKKEPAPKKEDPVTLLTPDDAPPIKPEKTEDPAKETTDNSTEKKPAAKAETPASVTAFVKELQDKGITKGFEELERLEEIGQENPALAIEAMKDLVGKLTTVNTDNLPEDLRDGVNGMRGGLNSMVLHMEEMPIPTDVLAGGEEAIGAWFLKQSTEDPDFAEDFGLTMREWGGEMQGLGQQMESSGEKLEQLFEKYGVDESELEN